MASCKYCGSHFKKNDANYFYALFVGIEIIKKDNYCCEAHYEMHTGKNWSNEWRSGVRGIPKRIGVIFIIMLVMTLAMMIIGLVVSNPKDSKRNTSDSSAISQDQDSVSRNRKKGGKKKTRGSDEPQKAASKIEVSRDDTLKNNSATDEKKIKGNSENVAQEDSSKMLKVTSEYFTDSRDNHKYKVVRIGNQKWFGENLLYQTNKDQWCYDAREENCRKFGLLYSWEAASIACPNGWKLPSKSDWEMLFKFAGKQSALKSSRFGDGSDDVKFGILPGGRFGAYQEENNFRDINRVAHLWSSTEDNANTATVIRFTSGTNGNLLDNFSEPKTRGASVRCIKIE